MKKRAPRVRIVGGGLAGVEAAHLIASRGVGVDLFEMRPESTTPAHTTGFLGELVCSNSLKGTDPETAHGLLKKEIQALGSLVIETAFKTRVPAGKALAVDREAFGMSLTLQIESNEYISLIREEVCDIDPEIPTIIASGPLTSDRLAARLSEMTGSDRLFFYDAISPIIDAASINYDHAFFGSRWAPDNADYLNCPLDKNQYESFVHELIEADKVKTREFENACFFDACLPVEVIAGRGVESLRFGPMRPVGIHDPKNSKTPYAVVQLRRENLKGDAYNLVGFQTRLTYPEQKRIFSMIPGLNSAQFFRYGSIHRNTFLDSPRVLKDDLSMREYPNVYLAGQITGVEGYVESAATGIVAGHSLLARLSHRDFTPPSADTAIGALLQYITRFTGDRFQPSNINFGIMEEPEAPKKYRKQVRLENESTSFDRWMKSLSQSY